MRKTRRMQGTKWNGGVDRDGGHTWEEAQAFQTYETNMSEEKKNIREAIKIE